MVNDNIENLATEAGKIMLENGGETYRVEQTINMICKAYNVKNVESLVSPTAIITSTTDERGKTSTIITRVSTRVINLEKVALVNDLSRKLQLNFLPLNKLSKELDVIKNCPIYDKKIKTLFAGINTSTFTLLFGGNIGDFFVAFIAGVIINLLSSLLAKLRVNDFFINIAGGAIASLIGLIASSINPFFSKDKIIIGSIMLLVPGLIITNAIRDVIAGDLVSGLTRGLEALVIAGAIAIGTAFSFKLWMLIF